MRLITASALVAGMAQVAFGQDQGGLSLAAAVSNYTELSTFSQVLTTFPTLLTQLVPADLGLRVTILIPSNSAFEKFTKSSGQAATSLPLSQLTAVFQYHILAAQMTSKNFTSSKSGIVVPTLLREKLYNNRTAGQALVNTFGAAAAEGNVVYVSPDPISKAKLKIRQSSPSVNIRGGLGATSSISAIDGEFNGGAFQIIDTILSPPAPCSNTIRTLSASLTNLDNALNRSGLYPTLDTSPNVTCLAPNNAAFQAAGNADATLNGTDLSDALLFHTLPLVTYSNYLLDGQVIKSLAGLDITVKVVDGNIYFNDAKVISPNVVTNNGLIHVLDKVMSPNGTAPGGGSTPTGTGTGTNGSPTATSTNRPNAGTSLSGNSITVGLFALIASMMLF